MKGWVNEGDFVPSIFRQDLVVYDTEEKYIVTVGPCQKYSNSH